MHDFLKPLIVELDKKSERNIVPYVNEVQEVSDLSELIRTVPYWPSPVGMQHVMLLRSQEILAPKSLALKYSHYGRLDVYTNGTCVFMVKDYVQGKDWCVRIFIWKVCAHTCTVQNLGRCYNRYTCTKCGYSYSIDSGD